jgi:methionyl-tRNA synthetase
MFLKLKEKNYIYTKEIQQLYDEKEKLFLADRFVKGECPKCKSVEQYGDNCEKCGATYSANDLLNPVSSYSDSTPVLKNSTHYFLKLDEFTDFLKEFITSTLSPHLQNKLLEWFEQPLRSWDISRDEPYFGFKIPGEESKYFYVWMDAPVGYMASFANLCKKINISFDEFWSKDSECEMYHFIGKDILYFHALFWPATLQGSDYRLPTNIFAHGFLTINGEKMSKSKNTFITANDFAENINTEALRYYFASKLNNSIADMDLNIQDFIGKTNSDLVGKIVNIASRCAGILKKNNNSVITNVDKELVSQSYNAKNEILEAYISLNYSKAIRLINDLADLANKYINDNKPWALAKIEGKGSEVGGICSTGINMFYHIIVFLSPVTPELATKSFEFLNTQNNSLNNFDIQLSEGLVLNNFEQLITRISPEDLNNF